MQGHRAKNRVTSSNTKKSINSREGVNESLTEARRSEAVCAGILVLVCVVSPIIIALVRNAVNTIQVITRHVNVKPQIKNNFT